MERSFWQGISAAQFAVPEGYGARQLLPELLGYLGSVDAELRDRFGYSITGHWIQAGHFTPAELGAVAEQMLPNLALGLGEVGTDSVFLRSFSTLILALVVGADNRAPYLPREMVWRIFEEAVRYLCGEQDLRGYVPGKGWAHSAAHTADLLDELAQSRHVGAVELERLLMAVAEKVTAPTLHRYDCDEDERLVTAVMTMLGQDLLGEVQLRAFVDRLFGAVWRDAYREEAQLGARHNTRLFLLALCLRLTTAGEGVAVAPALLGMLREPLRAMAWA